MTKRSGLVRTAYVVVPVHQYSDGTQTIASGDDGEPGHWGNVFVYDEGEDGDGTWTTDWDAVGLAETLIHQQLGLTESSQTAENALRAFLVWYQGETDRELIARRVCECGTCQAAAPKGVVGYLSGSDSRGTGFSIYIYTEKTYQALADEFGE